MSDTVYRERAHLVANLSAQYPSSFSYDENEPDWKVVLIQLPVVGQVSWHIAPDDMDLFSHVKDGSIKWDGHTTEEKYARLDAFTAHLARIGAALDEAENYHE